MLAIGCEYSDLHNLEVDQQIDETVVHVYTGGAFQIREHDGNVRSLRLFGIDAPEPTQPTYQESEESLERLLLNQDVVAIVGGFNLPPSPNVWVWVQSEGERSESINSQQVRDGMAWHYEQYTDSVDLNEAEDQARIESCGLWASEVAVAPWVRK